MTFGYIIYERSRRAVSHSLGYDVNIEKKRNFKKPYVSVAVLHLPTTLINH